MNTSFDQSTANSKTNTNGSIDFSTITTYGDLKNALPSTGDGRVPGINQLRDQGKLLLKQETESRIIEIYDNGFFIYEECGNQTVFGVDRCEHPEIYTYSGKKEAEMGNPDFSPYPWELILESAGCARLAHNADSRDEYHSEISLNAPESDNNIAFSVKPEHEFREEAEEMDEWKRKRIARLHKSMEKLTTRQREILNLYYVKEMTQEEIAAKLGIRQQSVFDVLKAGKEKMKKNF